MSEALVKHIYTIYSSAFVEKSSERRLPDLNWNQLQHATQEHGSSHPGEAETFTLQWVRTVQEAGISQVLGSEKYSVFRRILFHQKQKDEKLWKTSWNIYIRTDFF